MGLDSVELVIAWERAFDVEINPGHADRLFTIGSVTDLIAELLAADGRPRDRANIYALVRTLTCEQFGFRLDQLGEDTRFEDLGVD